MGKSTIGGDCHYAQKDDKLGFRGRLPNSDRDHAGPCSADRYLRLLARLQWPTKLHPPRQPGRCGTIGGGTSKCDREPPIRSGTRNQSRVSSGAYAQGMRSDYRSATPSKLPCELQSSRALHWLINLESGSAQRVGPIDRVGASFRRAGVEPSTTGTSRGWSGAATCPIAHSLPEAACWHHCYWGLSSRHWPPAPQRSCCPIPRRKLLARPTASPYRTR